MEDRKGNFKSRPNGLNQQHLTGVGANIGARGVFVLLALSLTVTPAKPI